jgi:hypothetical protein
MKLIVLSCFCITTCFDCIRLSSGACLPCQNCSTAYRTWTRCWLLLKILSHVRGSVTNNNGFWIGWSDYWHLLLQSLSITVTTVHNQWLSKTRSIPNCTTSGFSSAVTDLVQIYESVASSVFVVRWLTLHSWTLSWTIELNYWTLLRMPNNDSRINASVRARVTLRLAVYCQSVRLDDKPLETHDQNFYFSSEHLRFSPLWREDGSVLARRVRVRARVTLPMAVYRQSVLATSPLRPTTRIFMFQMNICGYSPYVTFSLTMRGWVCRLQLLLVLASAVILRSDFRGTHDHILLSQIRDFANLEGQVPVFISPRNRVARLYSQALDFLFVASYDLPKKSQSYVTTDGQSASLSWSKAPIWGLRSLLLSDSCRLDVGRFLWREDGSVVCQSHSSSNESVVSMYNLHFTCY